MRKGPVLLLLCGLLALAACDGLLLGDEPDGAPEEVFDLLWGEIDRYYAHFVVKDVDWDAVRARYRPRAAAAPTGHALYDTLCEMISSLEDGHVDLYAPEPLGVCSYSGWYEAYPRNFNFAHVLVTYLGPTAETAADGRLTYGRLDDGVGYLHVAAFDGTGWMDDVDGALAAMAPLEALVLDVRDNTGGRSGNAEALAGRFADARRRYAYVRYRDGPAHDAFTEPAPKYVEPAGAQPFDGPVAVLTNRRCYSACESFVMAMDVLPHVTVVGDTTGGGLGNPLFRELPNGWSYRVPVWIQSTPDGRVFEGLGLPPDVPVRILERHAFLGRDTILETALDVLRRPQAQAGR